MVFEAMNEEAYDISATYITYAKIFPHILDHFLTRKDAAQMMKPNNLPVNTTVTVNPGQNVTVVLATGAGATTAPGSGTGSGTVQVSYDGSYAHADSQVLKTEVKTRKEAGGGAVKGLTSAVSSATGG